MRQQGQALPGGWQGHEQELKELYFEMMKAAAQSNPETLPAYVQVLVKKGLATPDEAEQMRQEAERLASGEDSPTTPRS